MYLIGEVLRKELLLIRIPSIYRNLQLMELILIVLAMNMILLKQNILNGYIK
jgi:hypothetical protein